METSTSGGAGEGNPSQNAETKESKKPSNSAFKQQRLTAWQPILTAGTVLPTFFVIGILFIPVGIGLWFFSENVREITIPYTSCVSVNGEPTENRTCSEIIRENPNTPCQCEVTFQLDTQFSPRVFVYYALTNFYQNHRRYVKSRDDNQLWGDASGEDPTSDCVPFAKAGNKLVYPCGAIANSMFSDEISLWHIDNNDKNQVSLLRKGIAWDSDKKFKFKNPSNYSENAPMWKKYAKPQNWTKNLWELDPEDPENNGVQNEDLIVWMRTAALPNFRKLYRIVDSNQKYQGGLPSGNYSLKINYTYEVESFHGTKSIVISTTSLLGGKNPFLGISYIVVGTICLVLGVLFLFIHINYGKSTWEMTNVDPRTPWVAN